MAKAPDRIIFDLVLRTFENDIHFGRFESELGKIEADVQVSKKLQLLSEYLRLPLGKPDSFASAKMTARWSSSLR